MPLCKMEHGESNHLHLCCSTSKSSNTFSERTWAMRLIPITEIKNPLRRRFNIIGASLVLSIAFLPIFVLPRIIRALIKVAKEGKKAIKEDIAGVYDLW